jgi:hypothetical protein
MRMRGGRAGIAALVVALVGVGVGVAPVEPAGAAETVLVVTTAVDVIDAGDGVLSLREAVSAASAVTGGPEDTVRIQLLADVDHVLSLCDATRASEDDANAHGDLDYTGALPLVVEGPDPSIATAAVVQTCPTGSGERVLDAEGALRLVQVAVRGGDAAGGGGGVRGTTVVLEAALVERNAAAEAGGGVEADHVELLSGSVLENTSGGPGGGIRAHTVHVAAVQPDAVWIRDNVADGDGGGIAASGPVDLGAALIATNRSSGSGGGVHAPVVTATPPEGSSGPTVHRNLALGDGGGLHVGSATLQGVFVDDNAAAGRGGGIWADGPLSVSGWRVAENASFGDGAGIWSSGELTLEDLELTANHAALGDGGGVWSSGAADLVDVTATGNRAYSGGGLATSGPLLLDRSVLGGNVADAGGGGAWVRGAGPTWIRHTEVVDNDGTVGGLLYQGTTGDHLLHFTTLVGNARNLGVLGEVRVASTVLAEPRGENCFSFAPLEGPDPATAPIEAQGFQPSYATDGSCRLAGPGSTNLGAEPGFLRLPFEPFARVPAPTSPLRGAVRLPAGVSLSSLGDDARPVGTGADIGAREEDEALVHAIPARRHYDSRLTPEGALGPAATRVIDLTGFLTAVPERNQGALVNVTIVDPTVDTFLTIAAVGETSFHLGDVHAAAGTTTATANLLLPMSDGRIEVRNDAGTAHVLVDVVGYLADDGIGNDPVGEALTTIVPARLVDTRTGTPLGPGETRTFDVDGGVVPAGADGVVVNLTGVGASAKTHLTAWEAGTPRPPTSTLNIPGGGTVANQAVLPLDASGRFSVRNSSGTIHVLADVVGYLDEVSTDPAATDGGAHALRHDVAYDTRMAGSGGPLTGGVVRTVDLVPGTFHPIPVHARAAIVTLALTPLSAPAHLTAWATGTPRPPTSNVNAPAGVTRTNQAIVPIDEEGRIDLRISAGTAHVTVLVTGWVG